MKIGILKRNHFMDLHLMKEQLLWRVKGVQKKPNKPKNEVITHPKKHLHRKFGTFSNCPGHADFKNVLGFFPSCLTP